MSDLKSMRAELRQLRKEKGDKPISKMRKADIAGEIQRLKVVREETPAVAAVPSAPAKKMKAAAESIKSAKAREFPVMPTEMGKTEGKAAKKGAAPKDSKAPKEADGDSKKKTMVEKLMKLMENMDDE